MWKGTWGPRGLMWQPVWEGPGGQTSNSSDLIASRREVARLSSSQTERAGARAHHDVMTPDAIGAEQLRPVN